MIKANAAAYLQHLCYMDDPVKAKTRQLGGIAPLVALLTHDIPEIHRNACGALRYTFWIKKHLDSLIFLESTSFRMQKFSHTDFEIGHFQTFILIF